MKFEIEISEEDIEKKIKDFLSMDRGYVAPALRDTIRNAVQKALEVRISETMLSKFTSVIDEAINKEIQKAVDLKVPGWAKRRIKEILEQVRETL